MSAIPAVILAGGRASRMGGGDKCLRDLAGRMVLDHVLERLRDQAAPVALNANGDPARFADLGLEVLPDSVEGLVGPLAGVLAGMDWAAARGAAHVVSIAADTPFFPRDLVARLKARAQASGAPVVLAASRGEGGRIWRQPTFGLWEVRLREDLRAALRAGLRKVLHFTDPLGAADEIFEAAPQAGDPFFNINTPEDLQTAETLLKSARTG